jgi:hypothetical protein
MITDPLSSTNLPQQSSDPVPISAEDEGENVSEKQVPPAKQYRAAVLLNRFADTIFKAREKTLDQVAKKDPEKLQHDMEELERLRREGEKELITFWLISQVHFCVLRRGLPYRESSDTS